MKVRLVGGLKKSFLFVCTRVQTLSSPGAGIFILDRLDPRVKKEGEIELKSAHKSGGELGAPATR